jgi:hypothetical protein
VFKERLEREEKDRARSLQDRAASMEQVSRECECVGSFFLLPLYCAVLLRALRVVTGFGHGMPSVGMGVPISHPCGSFDSSPTREIVLYSRLDLDRPEHRGALCAQ